MEAWAELSAAKGRNAAEQAELTWGNFAPSCDGGSDGVRYVNDPDTPRSGTTVAESGQWRSPSAPEDETKSEEAEGGHQPGER